MNEVYTGFCSECLGWRCEVCVRNYKGIVCGCPCFARNDFLYSVIAHWQCVVKLALENGFLAVSCREDVDTLVTGCLCRCGVPTVIHKNLRAIGFIAGRREFGKI